MKRLNRKEIRFIALILAVCMIIGILYINDREKVALADDTAVVFSWPSALTSSDLEGCIDGETVSAKTLKFVVGTSSDTENSSNVSVNVPMIAYSSLSDNLKNTYSGIYYFNGDAVSSEENALTSVSLSKTNRKVTVFLKKTVNEETTYTKFYTYEWADVTLTKPTLGFSETDYTVNITGEGDSNKFKVSENDYTSQSGASPGTTTNIYVGQVKYCIDKNTAISDSTSWTDYTNAVKAVDDYKGYYEYDGTYYLHKAYYVGGTKVCDYSTADGALRMSTPAAPINDTPTVQKVVGTEGTTLTPSEGKYGGVNVGDTIQICITTSDTATSVKWNGTEDSTSTGDDTTAHTKGWTYEFVLGNAANNGDVTVTYKIKSKKGDDDEPDYDGSITLSVGDSKPVISDELTVKDADDNSISPIEGKYYVKKDVDNVFITTKVTMPTNANGATVSGVTIGEDGDGNPVPATLVTEGGNQYTVAAGTPVVDGANDIVITAKSSTGLSATPKTVTVVRDNAAPTISNFKLFQTGLDASGVGNIGGANEEDATTEQPDAPLTSTKAFSINFNLADAGDSSLDASSLHVYRKIGNGTESEVPATEDSGTPGLYVVNEDFTAKPSGCFNNVITYRVEVADKAGNVATMFYKYKFINETITVQPVVKAIEQVLSPYEEGTTKFRTDLSKIYVEYTVTTNDVKLQLSDLPAFNYDGADITIRAKAKDGTILKDINGEYGDADQALVSTGTEPYKYVFVVEYQETESASRSNITADFTNGNGYSVTDKITIISVDLTDPTATLNGDENTWYSSLVIKITCKDKDGNYYSGLKTAKLTQSGGVSGNGEQNILSGDPTEIPSFTVAQSSSVSGTTIKINVEDKVGRTYSVSKTYHVDEDKPTKENFTVGGIAAENIGDKVYEGDPVVAFGIKDNLNIAAYKLTVESPVGTKTVEGTNPLFTDSVKSVSSSKKVSEIIGQAVANGTYTLTLTAKDSAGNALDTVTTKFIVDNTKPVNDVIITTAKPAKFEKYHSSYSNPESGVSYEYGQYYAGKVSVDLQVIDDNVDTNDIVVTDNGDRVNVSWSAATINGKAGYKASYSTSNEGSHTITIATTDRAGQKATAKAVTYNVDNTAPTITASLNGSAISGGSGVRYLNVNGNVVVTANDKYFDEDDFTRVVKRTTPDKAVNNDTSNISNGSTPYTTDADYEITYKVVDRAGRETTLGPIEFRVDKVAPKLEVTGAASGGTARTNVSASMIITEDFYWDMTSVTCKIYKKVDGQGERLFEDVKVNPTSARTAINRALAEDGEYRFEMEATDKCGNHTTYTYSFIVDANAPLIELSGVKNYDSTDKAVDLIVKVTENFYTTNKLSISGTRTDINGDVEKLNLTGYNVNAAKVTTIPQQFKEDGIYDINVRSVDKAGNEDNKKVHFTIDSKAPIIKSLPEYDGTLFSEFKWDEDPDDLVTDLTVCQVTIFMDGVEYDGLTELSDGSHTLRIEAVDELGHESSAEYTFLVDTKPPTILVTGVENGEVILEERNIDISLQLDEDMLRSVTLNGKAISVSNNTAKLTINEKGTYTLKVEAVDKAGNVSTIEYTFTFGKTANWWWLIILIAAILLLLIIFFIIYKNRWNQKN